MKRKRNGIGFVLVLFFICAIVGFFAIHNENTPENKESVTGTEMIEKTSEERDVYRFVTGAEKEKKDVQEESEKKEKIHSTKEKEVETMGSSEKKEKKRKENQGEETLPIDWFEE
jgi:hypothetical protein